MKKQHSCQDEFDPNSLSFEQALQQVKQLVVPLSGRRCVTIREAVGCVLAEDVSSPFNVPAFINSAMDGYAVNSSDLPHTDTTRLKVIGKSFAGQPFKHSVKSGECVRIMTGAVVPEGTDSVIMQEHAETIDEHIIIDASHKKDQNVRHPGDDFSIGDTIIKTGERLSPAKLGLLASVGVTELNIVRTPVVAFFSTGDELKSVGQILQAGDIYDSNRYILFGMLHKMGVQCIDMGVIPDIKEK